MVGVLELQMLVLEPVKLAFNIGGQKFRLSEVAGSTANLEINK